MIDILRNNKPTILAVAAGVAWLSYQYMVGGPHELHVVRPDATDRSRIAHEQAETVAGAYADKLRKAEGVLPKGWVLGEGWSKPGEIAAPAPGTDI